MTEALERAARAVVATELLSGGYSDKMEAAIDIARAVLLAVRKPEEDVVQAGVAEALGDPQLCFTAMIDAILGEEG